MQKLGEGVRLANALLGDRALPSSLKNLLQYQRQSTTTATYQTPRDKVLRCTFVRLDIAAH
jgi:hypothetical protein